MKVLDDLWRGDIVPWEKTFSNDPEYREAVHHLAETDKRLRDVLTPAQTKLLDYTQDAEDRLNTVNQRDMFLYAFCLGARMILDVLEGTG